MSNELRVERDALKRAGDGFKAGADSLAAAGSSLEGKLSAEGKCWGADETGQAFEKDYAKNAQDVLKMITSIVENLGQMKEGIDRMAGTLGDAEDASGGR
ncbi:hypothetical protein [Spirillospora sp. NPDC029432]|uniref:hypothetical protein n=1 Tax=Spirillospora sp. NPDC029432 TaxID=3154599 RepID=UPI003453FCF3